MFPIQEINRRRNGCCHSYLCFSEQYSLLLQYGWNTGETGDINGMGRKKIKKEKKENERKTCKQTYKQTQAYTIRRGREKKI